MNIIKKLWVKTKFYSGLVLASLNLAVFTAVGIGAALLTLFVFAPVLALPLAALAAIATIGTGLILGMSFLINRWIWSKPTDMSKSAWFNGFHNLDTITVILESFPSDEERIAFLNQKDATGQTALTSIIDSPAENKDDLIRKILKSVKQKNRMVLLNKKNKLDQTIWDTIILSAAPYTHAVIILNCLNTEQTIALIKTEVKYPKNGLQHAVYYNKSSVLDLNPAKENLSFKGNMNDLIDTMLNAVSEEQRITLLNEINDMGYTVLESAVNHNNLCSISAILQTIHLTAEELITKNNKNGRNLIEEASKRGHHEALNLILKRLAPDQRTEIILNKKGEEYNLLERCIKRGDAPLAVRTMLMAIPKENRPEFNSLKSLAKGNAVMVSALKKVYGLKMLGDLPKEDAQVADEANPPKPVSDNPKSKRPRK